MRNTIISNHALRDRDGMAVIGRTKHDLMGIRYEEGEGGNTPPAPPAEPPAAPPAAPAAPPAPTPTTAPPAAPTPPPVQHRGDPDEHVRELREEAKERRIKLEQEQAAHQTTQQERDAVTAERDRLARENRLLLVAPTLGANAAALLDFTSFTKTFAEVDLSDEAKVTEAINNALEKNSAFKAGPALPPSSGGGHQGGTPPATPTSLEGAVTKALGG